MDREKIKQALFMINEQLAYSGARAEIGLYGGAVMCLVLNAREGTHDIDAIFAPKDVMNIAINNVGNQLGLPKGWFNDAVKGFVSANNDMVLFDRLSNLDIDIYVTRPEYLFAMKAVSCRLDNENELNDIKFLINYLDRSSVEQAVATIGNYFPENRVQPKTQYMLMEIFGGH